MAQYITNLQVSLDEIQESEFREQGYTKLNGDLNHGTNARKIYIWYKIGQENAITRIQFSFNEEMTKGLSKAGYSKIDKNLNEGAGGDTIYLWYFSGSLPSDVPITDLAVALNAEGEVANYRDGYQRLACDLNRNAGGSKIYLFVKRAKPVYISAIDASDNTEKDVVYFQSGYIRVDECTNKGTKGNFVFIWYKQTPDDKQALKGPLQVSINDQEYQRYQCQHYTAVNQNLNPVTNGSSVFLWYKKQGQGDPIRDLSVIFNDEVDPFENAGINVINKNLNVGQNGVDEFVCFCSLPDVNVQQ